MPFRLLFLSLLIFFSVVANTEEFQPLYPGEGIRDALQDLGTEQARFEDPDPKALTKNRRIFSQISQPTYKIIAAEPSANTGVAVIVLPGGGYVDNWFDKEGSDIALWLSRRGITSMVVKYSTMIDSSGKQIMSWKAYKALTKQDASQAFKTLRKLAPDLNVDLNKIGVMGFSAGAAIAHWHMFDGMEDERCCTVNTKTRPDFAALIYGSGFHAGKVDPPLSALNDPKSLPPIYMTMAGGDSYIPLNGPSSFNFYLDVIKVVPKSELHVYGVGGHGFGLDDRGYSVSLWLESFYRWLKDLEFIDKK